MTGRDFTKKLTSQDGNVGYIPGSHQILFIKTGQGGSIYGYENRYLDLAIEINERYGFSVFVSETVTDSAESFRRDILAVEEMLGTTDFEVYYIGVSKGGLVGIWYGADEGRIKRMLSINAPLMINYYGRTLPGIHRLGKARLTMAYGTLDPSYNYTPFAEKHAAVRIIEGADHNLTGKDGALMSLTEEYLLQCRQQDGRNEKVAREATLP